MAIKFSHYLSYSVKDVDEAGNEVSLLAEDLIHLQGRSVTSGAP